MVGCGLASVYMSWFPLSTHWVICVRKLTIIGSYIGLPPGRRQAIIWTNAGILLIEPIGTKFSEILIKIHIFSFKKMCLKMSSAKWRRFCPGLNVLKIAIKPFGKYPTRRYSWLSENEESRNINAILEKLAHSLPESMVTHCQSNTMHILFVKFVLSGKCTNHSFSKVGNKCCPKIFIFYCIRW